MSAAENVFVVSVFENANEQPLGKQISRRADGEVEKTTPAHLSQGEVVKPMRLPVRVRSPQ